MGDPKKIRKKYSTPMHPWQRQRIEEEKVLLSEYGLKNKKQLWKMISITSGYADQAKKLTPQLQSQKKEQAEKEAKLFIAKLSKLGLLSSAANLTDVLNLTVRDLMGRRLQTLVYKKGFARTIDQSRQLITHGHVVVNNKKITSPAYLVNVDEESLISYSADSSFSNPAHPERVQAEEVKTVVVKSEASEKINESEEAKPKSNKKTQDKSAKKPSKKHVAEEVSEE